MTHRTAIYGASGVAQPRRISNGVAKACERIAKIPGVHVEYTTYRADARQAASIVANELEVDNIGGFGHSAGGGWLVDWAWELMALGRNVDWLVLADAWKRSGVIVIPPNVVRVVSFTQCNNRPRGSAIHIDDPAKTMWAHHPNQAVRHAAVDEIVAFQDMIDLLAHGGNQ